MATLLVVDDNAVDREQIRRLLGGSFEVVEASTAREGMTALDARPFDCVLLDNHLPDGDGVDVVADFAARSVPVLLLTGQGSEAVAVEAMKRGALDYLNKSTLDRTRLRRALEGAFERGRLRAELEASNRALAEREAHLRVVLEQLPALTWTTDPSLTVTSLSGAALRPLRLAPDGLVGAALADSPLGRDEGGEVVAAHRRALEGEAAHATAHWLGRAYECHVEPLREGAAVNGAIGVALDVTEARHLEQQLRHALKMEALGKLAGGVAHDFANLLMVIVNYTSFARDTLGLDDPARGWLDESLAATQRAASLVRQLLAFSRKQPARPRTVLVGDAVRSLIPMLQRLMEEDTVVDLEVATEAAAVCIDPSGLEQVVINLAVNARDAMPRGGRVFIEVRDVRLTGEAVQERGYEAPPGAYVMLAVTDEGVGIPADVRDHVFEPFFTTKEVGRGTGIGLSTVYGIVRQAGGAVTLYSEVGHGTTFRVYLPRVDAAAAEQGDAETPAERADGSETVLLVEDEPMVREASTLALERAGYRVLSADGHDAAMARCAETPGPIDLLLTDVVMPGKGGAQVAESVRALRPSIKVVFMSGYTERAVRSRQPLPAEARVLEKPMAPDALVRAVRSALDGA